jgi:glycosyltransferase involved in cell wall biosynthesis
LLHQLQSLIRSPEKRAKLGQTSKARAQRFTLERMAGDYLACYAALRCRNHPATALRS